MEETPIQISNNIEYLTKHRHNSNRFVLNKWNRLFHQTIQILGFWGTFAIIFDHEI